MTIQTHKDSNSEEVLDAELKQALHSLMADGICSQVMGTLTGGAFLVAFALLLGASNAVIGIIAAIPSLAQLMQLPAIFIVNRVRRRRVISVITTVAGRTVLCSVAAVPWVLPNSWHIPYLVGALAIYFGLGAVGGCSFNSWMRDLIPEKLMGRVFSRRLALGTALSSALSLAAGIGVDFAKTHFGDERAVYSGLFLIGSVFGLVGSFFLARIHEPAMPPQRPMKWLHVLTEPLRHENYRKVLGFLASWNVAVNLASPFFIVYMLKRLELSMAYVLSLFVLSQVVNVVFFRIWGNLADRFSNKSVLTVAGPLFVLTFILWPFTTMPERHVLTLPLLVAIHILAGISTAGVNLCTANLALKAAPLGEATTYVAVNAIISGVIASVAPVLGGLAADWFSSKELTVTLSWLVHDATTRSWDLPAFNLRGLDFLFLTAFIFGLYASHRLLAVREEGEVHEKIVVEGFYAEVRKALANVSSAAGLRHMVYFPYAVLQFSRNRKDRKT